MLTTDNLLYLTQMIPNFCGVYSFNCLPKLQDLNCNANLQKQLHNQQKYKTLIVNLDTDNLPGSHWVALAKCENGLVEIFDSFGTPPPSLLQAWAQNWTYKPSIMIQHPDAVTCGYYAFIFCVARPHCDTLLDTLKYISTLNI